MGINGRQVEEAAWLVKLYWRSKCGRTLSPKTPSCLGCGDSRPDKDGGILTELDHEAGPEIVRLPYVAPAPKRVDV